MILHRPPQVMPDAGTRPLSLKKWYQQTHILPDKDGMLEVLAHCQEHFVMQSQADMKAGIAAPCKWEKCAPSKVCKVCHVEKPKEKFPLQGNKGCRRTMCKSCLNAQHRKAA